MGVRKRTPFDDEARLQIAEKTNDKSGKIHGLFFALQSLVAKNKAHPLLEMSFVGEMSHGE